VVDEEGHASQVSCDWCREGLGLLGAIESALPSDGRIVSEEGLESHSVVTTVPTRWYWEEFDRPKLSRSPARDGAMLVGLAHRDDCTHYREAVSSCHGRVTPLPAGLVDTLPVEAFCIDCARRDGRPYLSF
jgi:hypothetical protein